MMAVRTMVQLSAGVDDVPMDEDTIDRPCDFCEHTPTLSWAIYVPGITNAVVRGRLCDEHVTELGQLVAGLHPGDRHWMVIGRL